MWSTECLKNHGRRFVSLYRKQWPHRPKEKEMKEGKVVVCEGFTNSWGRKRSEKKDLNDLDNHECMITHLKPDILECKVMWALESIIMNKASGGDGIPIELLQILKDDGVKVLLSTCQQIWKTQQWPQHWKRSVFIPIPKKGNAK